MNYADDLEQLNLFQKGLDAFGQNPVAFGGFGINAKAKSYYEAGVPSTFIQDGDLIVRLNVVDGYLQSSNFVTGVSGWRIDSDGNAEFDSGYFRGDITGASGAFSGSISIGSGNNIFKADSSGIYLGNAVFASAPFRVTMTGAVTASNINITGGTLAVGTDAWHVDSSGNIWWGSSSTYAGATIKISAAGALYCDSGTFSGSITGATGTFNGQAATIAGQGSLATLSVVGNAYISGDLYARSFIGKNTGSGADIYISSTGYIYGKYDTDVVCSIQVASDGSVNISGNNNINFEADSVDTYYNDDNDGADAHWRGYADNMKMKLTSGGELQVEDDVVPNAGIDYAERFESLSGKPIPPGTSVILEGDKVRPAEENEEPDGAISTTPAVIAGGGECDCGTSWKNKYLKDVYGQYIEEESDFWRLREKIPTDDGAENTFFEKKSNGWCDEVPAPKEAIIKKEKRRKINPAWNKDEVYIPRAEREEWVKVGLVGQMRINKGQPIGKNWKFMKELNKDVDLYLVR